METTQPQKPVERVETRTTTAVWTYISLLALACNQTAQNIRTGSPENWSQAEFTLIREAARGDFDLGIRDVFFEARHSASGEQCLAGIINGWRHIIEGGDPSDVDVYAELEKLDGPGPERITGAFDSHDWRNEIGALVAEAHYGPRRWKKKSAQFEMMGVLSDCYVPRYTYGFRQHDVVKIIIADYAACQFSRPRLLSEYTGFIAPYIRS